MSPRPTITGAARIAGVAGWPVAHSLSPVLHNAWIAAAGLDAAYVPFAIQPENAAAAFRALPKLGLRGLNVTVPHKTAALEAADEVGDAARRIGAANMLTVDEEGRLVADNTDALGFLDGLTRADVDPELPAVILGAGGAARAVVIALADAGCPHVTIINRSVDKARELAKLAETLNVDARAGGWDALSEALGDAHLLVNATSLGMTGGALLDVDLTPLPDGAAVYDLVYTPRETELLAAARARGLKPIEGLDMLIGQARPSFSAFFDAPPPETVDARALLEAALSGASGDAD